MRLKKRFPSTRDDFEVTLFSKQLRKFPLEKKLEIIKAATRDKALTSDELTYALESGIDELCGKVFTYYTGTPKSKIFLKKVEAILVKTK